MRKLGFSPPQVKQMEVWEAAVLLGVEEQVASKGSLPTPRELARQRVLHARGLGPPPQVAAMRDADIPALSLVTNQ